MYLRIWKNCKVVHGQCLHDDESNKERWKNVGIKTSAQCNKVSKYITLLMDWACAEVLFSFESFSLYFATEILQ